MIPSVCYSRNAGGIILSLAGLIVEHDNKVKGIEDRWDKLTVPYWLVLLCTVPFSALALRRGGRLLWRMRCGHCLACGYDLRETSGRCPECGALASMLNGRESRSAKRNAAVPVLAAALCWPILYFQFYLATILLLPFVLGACVAWCCVQHWVRVRLLSASGGGVAPQWLSECILFFQLLGIILSLPAFAAVLIGLQWLGFAISRPLL